MPTGIYTRTNKHKNATSIAGKGFYKTKKGEKLKQYLSKNWLGKNNPKFNNWITRKKNYCIDCGKDIDIRSKRCYKCRAQIINPKGMHHSERSKKLIGIASKAKFTKEFKQKMRKINEDLGLYVPLKDLNPYYLYCRLTGWDKNISKYLPNKELIMLKQIGLFSRKNSKGLVRDHRYSRYSGFKNKVFPAILRHPINCQIITHRANLIKAKKCHRYKDGDSISLKQLFDLIQNYRKKWFEQKDCLNAIHNYDRGKRHDIIYGGSAL